MAFTLFSNAKRLKAPIHLDKFYLQSFTMIKDKFKHNLESQNKTKDLTY